MAFLNLKKILTKILQSIRRLPNYYSVDGGNHNRPTTADISSDNSGGVIQFLATDRITDKPAEGNILHFNWDNSNAYASQLLVGHTNNGIFHRTQDQDSGTTWGSWYPIAFKPRSISDNANLNDYLTPGDYYCQANSTAATITNSPVTVAFKLYVRKATNPYYADETNYRYRVQTIETYVGDRWVRSIDTSNGGSSWTYGDWKNGVPNLGYAAYRNVANNLTTASAGSSVLDAYQGKVLNDKFGDYVKTSAIGTAASKSVANNLTTASAGSSVLDAYQGKVLNDKFGSYLPKSGGTATGNITVNHSNTTESDLRVSNTQADGYLYAGSGGNFGLYNAKLSHALIIEDKNGNVSIHNFGSTTRTATTLAANTSAHRYNAIGFEKIGHIVRVQIGILYNLPASTDTTIGTAPEGYRPAMVAQTMVFCTTTGKGIRINIATDGVMKAYNYGAAATGNVNLQAELMYFTLS